MRIDEAGYDELVATIDDVSRSRAPVKLPLRFDGRNPSVSDEDIAALKGRVGGGQNGRLFDQDRIAGGHRALPMLRDHARAADSQFKTEKIRMVPLLP
jgi:hypothetical protein